jgi:hypothetical protein
MLLIDVGKDEVGYTYVADAAAECIRFDDETFADSDALARSLSPLVKIMKVTGSYFDKCTGGDNHTTNTEGNEEENNNKQSSNLFAKYAAVLTIFVWFVALWLFMAFRADDQFGELLISKLVMTAIHCEVAIVKTAYYFVSRSGKLDDLLHQMRVSSDFVRKLPKLVKARIILFAPSSIAFSVLYIYTIFFTNGKLDFFVCSFVLLIPLNSHWLTVAKSVFTVVDIWVLHGFIWTLTMNQLLGEILIRQFQMINHRFRIASNRRGQFKGKLKTFRKRHQALCRDVRTVDSLLMITNAAIFFRQMFVIILLLYNFVFLGLPDPAVLSVYFILFLLSATMLTVCTTSGTLINHSVSI